MNQPDTEEWRSHLTRAQVGVVQAWTDAGHAVTWLGFHQVRIGGGAVALEWGLFHVERTGAVALDVNGKQVLTNGAAHLAAMRAACAVGLPAVAPEIVAARRQKELDRDHGRRRPQVVQH